MLQRPIGFIEPCQPSAAHKPPSGPGWIHEIKHDGYRMMALRAGRRVRLFTRNGNDWSELFPAVVTAVGQLNIGSCLIDGEVVVCDEQGLAVFDLLRHGRRVKHEAHLYAFDLLELDGRDLMRAPIEDRKHELVRLLRQNNAGVQLCAHLDQPGDVVFAHACKLGCEGIVSKRVGSKYRRGPGECSDLDQGEEPGLAGCEAGSRGGVGEAAKGALSLRRMRLENAPFYSWPMETFFQRRAPPIGLTAHNSFAPIIRPVTLFRGNYKCES